jgi:hypothetical protein
MVDRYVDDNGVRRLATADELAEINARETAWSNDAPNRKLAEIRKIRNKKLQETDWLVTSEQITDAEKTWRENLRKIPQDYTTESQYDELLARDASGNLTHSVWSKP